MGFQRRLAYVFANERSVMSISPLYWFERTFNEAVVGSIHAGQNLRRKL